MNDLLYDNNYSFQADVCTVAVCILCWILLQSTYNSRNRQLFLFRISICTLIIAAWTSIVYHFLLDSISHDNLKYIYITHNISFMALISTMELFFIYICDLVEMRHKIRKTLLAISALVFSGFVLLFALSPITHFGLWIDKELNIHQNYVWDPFRFAYCTFFVAIAVLVFLYRKRFITKVLRCIILASILSFVLMAVQTEFQTSTYTCISFTFPIMAVLFLFHYNTFDVDTGTFDAKAFSYCLHNMKNRNFTIIWLYIQNDRDDYKIKISEQFFKLNEKHFKNPVTLRLRDDKLACVYRNDQNIFDINRQSGLFDKFIQMCVENRTDYKLVSMNSDKSLVTSRDYQDFDDFIESKMKLNSVRTIEADDLHRFLEYRYLTEQLSDINSKADLLDDRIKVYCQPVYNTETGTFSTAEALMRMELPECGIVFPDQFIPIAEKYGYIHTLSEIILNKTCHAISILEKEGYLIERISINFSIQELRSKDFCKDVVDIINQNGISFDKIAVELTESRNERDFENVKNRMADLQKLGIKFYLDDFGTGYSNFERIMQLPIDVIKFDRSLTVMAGKDEESRFMVGSFSDIFQKANYQILFEGVETENDEKQCMEMKATYLQGYRYSKPVPVEQLKTFLQKNN